MISKDKVIVLMHLISSFEDFLKELDRAQDTEDYNTFISLKKHLMEIQKEISKNLKK